MIPRPIAAKVVVTELKLYMNDDVGCPPKKYTRAGVCGAITAVIGCGILCQLGKNVARVPDLEGESGLGVVALKAYIFTLFFVED